VAAFLDEAGFRLLPTIVRTWAPKGQTPILRPRVRRRHLSAISALTMDGKLFFGLQDHAYNSASVARFLRRLLRQIKGRLLLFWDGSNIHGGPPLRELLAGPEGARIQTVRFPGYAPELNPAELVWGQLKHVEMKNVCCDTLAELRATIERAVRRLRRKGELLRAFVRHALPP
jgi:transposase